MDAIGTMFDYLLEKISAAKMVKDPFTHVEIANFLTKEHFEAIVHDRQICLDSCSETEGLLDSLTERGYQIIPFPGCVTSKRQYLDWFRGASEKSVHAATEGFGLVCRLVRCDSLILRELDDFFVSDRLKELLVEKFGIHEEVQVDSGIQKYLHGYEISPHPDIRRKAVTWMLNLNPGDGSEGMDFHTHYMTFKDQWGFVGEFWRYNQDVERCWLPWDWCTTVKQQTRNNSIVLFRPADDTLHAVKASYDHLKIQRTQAYGNLWYRPAGLKSVEFAAFDLKNAHRADVRSADWRSVLKRAVYRRLESSPLSRLGNYQGSRRRRTGG
ncbi:MAG TPA: hypothetical protein VHW44_29060 [Pseudonocardiaceae bacterium]|jgi:hypothetical protein|nr:hypothetical protein [Pseudonocardiaceae bacterium]